MLRDRSRATGFCRTRFLDTLPYNAHTTASDALDGSSGVDLPRRHRVRGAGGSEPAARCRPAGPGDPEPVSLRGVGAQTCPGACAARADVVWSATNQPILVRYPTV